MYKRILIKSPNWLGDAVMALPTVKGMRTLFPESHLAVLVKSELADLFQHDSDINEVISYESRKGLKRLSSEYKLIKEVKSKGFDLALILPRSFHSALIGFLSKIPNRIGYSADSRGKLLTQSLPRDKESITQHRVYYFHNLLNIIGRPVSFSAPRITIPKAIRDWVTDKLAYVKGHAVVGLNPGATYGSAKCWPAERYARLARELINKKKAWVIIFGSPAEEKLGASIARQINHHQVLDFTGQTSITQMAGLLAGCKLLVTNDTGTMHVAAAVNTPVVAIFGPTDHVTTPPFGSNHTIIRKEVACSPCLKRTCPTDHRCMTLITVEDIYKECEKYL
ncbi:MAG: lipopolysaccharide heptosyltransferase II [Planctomycetes bacterium]|nr:lipopolysaccharide heptosyltransferase II [Planctomycetota bacterium]